MSGTPFSNVIKQSMVPEDQKNMTTQIFDNLLYLRENKLLPYFG